MIISIIIFVFLLTASSVKTIQINLTPLPPEYCISLFWPFDGSINNASNLVDSKQNVSISPGIYGRGLVISFDGLQYRFVSSPYLDTASHGFTFEL